MTKNLHGTPTLKFCGCAIWRAGKLWAVVGPNDAFVAVKKSLAEAMTLAANSRR